MAAQVNETAFQCSRSGSVVVLRSLDSVDTAFRLRPAAPATGAGVFIGLGATGAGHASDREITGRRERMRRQFCLGINRRDRLSRDVCERIEFQPYAVFLDDGNRRTRTALKTLAPVDPCIERRQR